MIGFTGILDQSKRFEWDAFVVTILVAIDEQLTDLNSAQVKYINNQWQWQYAIAIMYMGSVEVAASIIILISIALDLIHVHVSAFFYGRSGLQEARGPATPVRTTLTSKKFGTLVRQKCVVDGTLDPRRLTELWR